jgi:signal transduction histidine kinase
MGVGLELKAKRKDESLFPIEISLSHFKSDEKIYYIVFVSDVTLKRKVETELILRNQEINQLNESLEDEVKARTHALQNTLETLELQTKVLEQSLEKEILLGDMKTRFVSMASHEFRTPLTSILSSASIIEKYVESVDQPKQNQHIQRIKSSVAHMTEILEEFLFAGKLEAGKVEVRPETFNVSEFLIDLVTELDGMRRPDQKIVLQTSPTINDFVSDTSMLRKVLLNGLSNALKFSQKDVLLKASLQDEALIFEIIDQGIGIEPNKFNSIFDAFTTDSRRGTANEKSIGLGLSICKKIVELHHGKIWVESTPHVGSKFFIILPINYLNQILKKIPFEI